MSELRLVLHLDLGNAAMQSAAEAGDAINRALLGGARSMLDPLVYGEEGVVSDANGNSVGRWRVEEGARYG